MIAWETALSALGGALLGAAAAVAWARHRERRWSRRWVEAEARLRRAVVPVLERRAAVLGIPAAERGRDADGALALTLTLAAAISAVEDSDELPFGDTVDASRQGLSDELRSREDA